VKTSAGFGDGQLTPRVDEEYPGAKAVISRGGRVNPLLIVKS
jgi:hypothetical protein